MTLVGIALAGLFLLVQVNTTVLAVLSFVELRRHRIRAKYQGFSEVMRGDLSPPVSIVVAAFNEAAGIVDAVRSMALLRYPGLEIIVVNDGSTDATLDLLIEAFGLRRVTTPFRDSIPTAKVRGVYRGTLPVTITVLDKENGGRADARNAGVNLARYPYVLFVDADVILEPDALLRLMRPVVEDRERTVAVAGNIRPLNGCSVRYGHVARTHVPRRLIERFQVLEYLRAFLASRPGWSLVNALPIISGAFALYRREAIVDVGGLRHGHLGEDLDLSLRVHRHFRERHIPYRIVYAPDAVCWTEVPSTASSLRRQRIRWHSGLLTAVRDHRAVLFNPRYGAFGVLGWGMFVLTELVGPIAEAAGLTLLAVGWPLGFVDPEAILGLFLVGIGVGALNSLAALFLDEEFGYFNAPFDALRLAWLVFGENLGLRQRTVVWRLRATLGGEATRVNSIVPRRGVAHLG